MGLSLMLRHVMAQVKPYSALTLSHVDPRLRPNDHFYVRDIWMLRSASEPVDVGTGDHPRGGRRPSKRDIRE